MNILSIASSGMRAESLRLETVASNLANMNAVSGSASEVYKARYPVFSAQVASMQDAYFPNQRPGRGVNVVGVMESQANPIVRYEPGHPMADESGNIYTPNVNLVEQLTDMISASRSHQTQSEIFNSGKKLVQETLALGQG